MPLPWPRGFTVQWLGWWRRVESGRYNWRSVGRQKSRILVRNRCTSWRRSCTWRPPRPWERFRLDAPMASPFLPNRAALTATRAARFQHVSSTWEGSRASETLSLIFFFFSLPLSLSLSLFFFIFLLSPSSSAFFFPSPLPPWCRILTESRLLKGVGCRCHWPLGKLYHGFLFFHIFFFFARACVCVDGERKDCFGNGTVWSGVKRGDGVARIASSVSFFFLLSGRVGICGIWSELVVWRLYWNV